MGATVTEQEFFSEPVPTVAEDEPKKTITPEEFFGAEDKVTPKGIPSIPDEHRSSFINSLGDAIYNQALNTTLRAAGGSVEGVASIQEVLGSILPPNPMSGFVANENTTQDKYRELFVDPLKAEAGAAKLAAPGENTFEKVLYGFAESLGTLPPVILSDVMTGGATKMALTGQVLPRMEALLSRIPNFALGSGWRGMVDGINNTEGGTVEKTIGGIMGAGESVAVNTLFASAGTGLKGIGKMMSLGLAQSFYNAAKEGRLPTHDEMIEHTTQAGMMGVLFTALPHLAEAAQVAEEKRAIGRYLKRVDGIFGEKWYHGGVKGLEGDLIAGMVTKDYAEAKRYANEVGGMVYEVPNEGVIQATVRDTGADGQSLGKRYKDYGFIKPVSAGKKGWDAKIAVEPVGVDPGELQKIMIDLMDDSKVPEGVRNTVAEVALTILKDRGKIIDPGFEYGQWKDPSRLTVLTQTMERTIEKMDPAHAKETQEFFTNKIKENETLGSDWLRKWVNWIWEKPIRELGIKPRSDQDKILFDYAEGKATTDQLKTVFPDNWKRAIEIVNEGKSRYKQALDEWNLTRKKYGFKPVPERSDYVRHMRELRTAKDMLGWFFSEKTPTEVAAIVKARRQGRPISSAEMEREGESSERSYVLSMQDYGEVVKNSRFHLDSVQRGRWLENYIRAQAAANETAIANGEPAPRINLQNFMSQITQYTNYMAGQPSRLTRAMKEDLIGRKGFAIVRYFQQTPVMNMVSGNVSMLLVNALTAPQLAAYGVFHPVAVGKGTTTALLYSKPSNWGVPLEIEGQISSFSTRRTQFNKIPKDWVEDVADKGMVFAKLSDQFMLNTIVASRYWQHRSEGMSPKDAMAKADDVAVRIIGDRSLGQQPLLFTEPALKFFTSLQFEINNLWSNLSHDIPNEYKGQTARLVSAYAAYALVANLMNNVLEKVTGNRPGFDPLYILSTLVGSTYFGANPGGPRPFMERFDDAADNLLGNIPFIQPIIQRGGRFPMSAAFPDFEAMKEDPKRIPGELARTALYLDPLGWGGQMKKSWGGVQTWFRGGDVTSSGKKFRYRVDKNFVSFVQGFLFGKNSFPEAVRYWNQAESERR